MMQTYSTFENNIAHTHTTWTTESATEIEFVQYLDRIQINIYFAHEKITLCDMPATTWNDTHNALNDAITFFDAQFAQQFISIWSS